MSNQRNVVLVLCNCLLALKASSQTNLHHKIFENQVAIFITHRK